MDAQLLLRIAEYIAAIGAGIAAINQWVVKPLKGIMDKQKLELQKINDKIDSIDNTVKLSKEEVCELLRDRLETAHDQFVKQGWCSDADKEKFVSMHKRYTERGENHLTAFYEQELLALPNHPPERD